MSDSEKTYYLKCKQHRDQCVNYRGGKCLCLDNVDFKRVIDGVTVTRVCPFYKVVDSKYKYCVYDRKYKEILEYFTCLDDARIHVRIISGDYYASGLDNKRFIICDWKGKTYGVK